VVVLVQKAVLFVKIVNTVSIVPKMEVHVAFASKN
jgi:hypothetical protein